MEKIKDKRYLIAIALATAVVVLFALWPPAAVEAVYPFDRVRTFFSRRFAPAVAAPFRAAALADENRALRRTVGELSLLRDEVARVEAENVRLRAAFGFRQQLTGTWIPAEVLSSEAGAAGVWRRVRLSKGSRDGVVRDAVVVVPEGLVGRVVSVTPHTCAVMLATDPSLRVACEIETGAGACPRGILCGGDGDCLDLLYLTRAGGLSPARQRVITSGLGGVFPRGLFVGYLSTLGESSATVRLGADLSDLEFVFIRHEG